MPKHSKLWNESHRSKSEKTINKKKIEEIKKEPEERRRLFLIRNMIGSVIMEESFFFLTFRIDLVELKIILSNRWFEFHSSAVCRTLYSCRYTSRSGTSISIFFSTFAAFEMWSYWDNTSEWITKNTKKCSSFFFWTFLFAFSP